MALYELSVRIRFDRELIPDVADALEYLVKGEVHGLQMPVRRLCGNSARLQSFTSNFVKLEADDDKLVAEMLDILIENLMDEDCLDELVLDTANHSASHVNNQGLEGQIRFLLGELGEEETRTSIKEIIEEKETK